MSDIANQVKAIIVDKLAIDESKVTEDANLQSDLNADSLDTVEVIMDFEDRFGIKFPDEATEQIKTVGDAIRYIEEAVAAKAE